MANNGVIDSEEIVLFNHWGAAVSFEEPKDGFTGSEHHNVAAAAFPVGTVVQVYCDGSVGKIGYSQFVYLKLEMQDATNVLAARMVCALHTDKEITDVTNEVATALADAGGFCAVGLSAMTVDYYGWFWCGGVCPEQYVTALGGWYATNDSVAVATPCLMVADLATAGTTYGEIGFATQTAGFETCGMTYSNDSGV
jgi:hypothetical protein